MNTLCILSVYNEIDYLPVKVEYCRRNRLLPYFIDNLSTDGTWEWLQRNNVQSHRFDTGGAFNLRLIQDEIVKTIHRVKPDWVVYNGCDLFPLTNGPLGEVLEMIDRDGYNAASIFCISMCNTGEVRHGFDPFNTYFFYEDFIHLTMMHKYDVGVKYNADNVSLPDMKTFPLPGVMINYGNTKTAQERKETLERRKRAWEQGENPAHGQHYVKGAERDWTWNREELRDVRLTPCMKYVEQLQRIAKTVRDGQG